MSAGESEAGSAYSVFNAMLILPVTEKNRSFIIPKKVRYIDTE